MLKLGIAIGLGAAAWYWRKEIGEMLETQFPGIVDKTSRTLDMAGESSEKFLAQAKSRVSGT